MEPSPLPSPALPRGAGAGGGDGKERKRKRARPAPPSAQPRHPEGVRGAEEAGEEKGEKESTGWKPVPRTGGGVVVEEREQEEFEEGNGTPARDPRLEIPEVLRRPIDHPSKRPPAKRDFGSGLGDLGAALAMGLDFLFTAAAGGGAGYLIDRWLGSSPTGLLVGLGVGFVAGTWRLIQRSNAQDRARRGGGGAGRS